MVERRGRELDLAARRGRRGTPGTTLRRISSSTARSVGLVLFGEAASLRDQRADAFVRVEVERVDPDQLVPDLQVAEVVGRELRRLARALSPLPLLLAPRQQLRVARIRVDHPRPVRVEEVLDAERALVLGQRVGRLQPQLEVPIARLVARERLELHQQRRHQVERHPARRGTRAAAPPCPSSP